MNQTKNNSDEFVLGKPAPRVGETPYKTVVKKPPKGYLNPLEMPFLSEAQRRRLKKSLAKRGTEDNV